jgi:imidazolonepropionase-like amidohydrolase
MRDRRLLVGAVLIGTLCGGVVAALVAQPPASNTARGVVFEGARLITGDGRVIERAAFVVDNGRFATVGDQGSIAGASNATRVDLTGKTVMPALVDVHTHLGYRNGATFAAENFTREIVLDELSRFAYYGVAAVASAGTDRGDLTLQLRNAPHPGALVRTAWRGLAPPDAGPNPPMRDAPYGISSEADARRDVRELAAKKVDFVKIWVDDRNGTVPKLNPALYRAIIDEAHQHNLRVFAHIATLADAKDLLRSGIDGFLHVVRDREVDDELLALLEARPQIFFTLTLFGPALTTYGPVPAWLDEPAIHERVPADAIAQVKSAIAARSLPAIDAARGEFQRLGRNIAALNAAGVRLALGTDVGGASAGGMFGWTEHVELEHMVAAGLTPAQAIAAATQTAAAILRIDDLGTIAPGKSASFIVLDANPLERIANTRRIARVYLRGEEVQRTRSNRGQRGDR